MGRSWNALLATAGVLSLAGCELAVIAATGATFSIVEDRRTSGTQLEDETIQIRAQSRVNDRFGDKAHVTVTSFNRIALLTGEAPDDATREEISRLVQQVPNVKAIANELQLAPPSSRGSRINDEFITTKIKARLLDSEGVSLVHVKVITEAAVVFLLGLVTQAEADRAVEVARTTGGVRKVVKLFEYCEPTDAVCKPRPVRPSDAPRPTT